MQSILLNFDKEITETIKYGMPCFCYKGKAFCYLWKDKKTNSPYFLLVDGNKMKHPQLESGDRKRMKVFNVNPNEDLPLEIIHEILSESLSFYSNLN